MNLFIFDVSRLSVDIDLNYVGAEDRHGLLDKDLGVIDERSVEDFSRLSLFITQPTPIPDIEKRKRIDFQGMFSGYSEFSVSMRYEHLSQTIRINFKVLPSKPQLDNDLPDAGRAYNQFNTKRRIKNPAEDELQHYSDLAEQIKYGGNPERKKNPGDFGLTPPSGPRPGKSLCDTVGIFSRQAALEYFKSGLRKGLISDRFNGQWPLNIWSVTEDGYPLEAQLENPITGTYHGYPMPLSDPLAAEIVRRWNIKNG